MDLIKEVKVPVQNGVKKVLQAGKEISTGQNKLHQDI